MLKLTRLANPFRQAKKDYRRTYLTVLAVLLVLAAALVTFVDTHQRSVHAASGDWSMFQGNNARSGYNGLENLITPATISNLHLQWVQKSGGNIVTQPIVVGGQVFWGSWDGKEYATDLNGNVIWSTPTGGQTPDCTGTPIFGASSTAAVHTVTINGNPTLAVFVNGRDPNLNVAAFYALDAATGAVLWETPLSSSTASYGWSSPAFYNGSIYIGLASGDDCPLVRGALVQLNATTGAIQNTFYTVPVGCIGASIWSSPAIDDTTGIVYVTTGNSGFKGSCTTKEIYGQAIIALNASNLSYIASWQIPLAQRINDPDFGATPTLFTATIAGVTHQMIGAENKSGVYYAFDRTNLTAGPLWTATVGGGNRNISPSAWDGSTLYVASQLTTIKGVSCKGALRALNPATGSFIWETCLNYGNLFPAVMAIPGVAFVGEGTHIVGISTANGQILFNYSTTDIVKGAASVSNGVLYVGNNSGNLYSFSLSIPPTVTPSPGSILAQDTFQRQNQSFWGVASDGMQWGTDANKLAAYSISNNTGQIVASSAQDYVATLGQAATNAEVLFTGSISSLGTSNTGAILRWNDLNDYYRVTMNGTQLNLFKKVGGTTTKLASVAFSASASVAYTIRFRIVGTTLSAKAWQANLSEPQNWMVTATDSALSSGYCGLLMYLQSGVTVNVTSYQATAQ